MMDEKVRSNEQKVLRNEQKITNNNQIVTSKEQKLTSNEQKVMSNEEKVTSNEQNVESQKVWARSFERKVFFRSAYSFLTKKSFLLPLILNEKCFLLSEPRS